LITKTVVKDKKRSELLIIEELFNELELLYDLRDLTYLSIKGETWVWMHLHLKLLIRISFIGYICENI